MRSQVGGYFVFTVSAVFAFAFVGEHLICLETASQNYSPPPSTNNQQLSFYFYFYCIVCLCPLGLRSPQASEACETRTVKAQCAPHAPKFARSCGIGFHIGFHGTRSPLLPLYPYSPPYIPIFPYEKGCFFGCESSWWGAPPIPSWRGAPPIPSISHIGRCNIS